MKKAVLALALLVTIFGCGRSTETVDPPITEPGPGAEVSDINLLLFAAPWCKPCKEELPEIQRLYNEQLTAYADKLGVTVYIETGAKQSQLPTQEIANSYGEALGLSFTMRPDSTEDMKFPKWPKYREYFGGGFILPTAAVLDADGNVLKTFKPSVPEDVVNYLKSQLEVNHE